MPTNHGKSPWNDSLKPLEAADHSDPFAAAAVIQRFRVINAAINAGELKMSFAQVSRAAVASGIAQGLVKLPTASTSR
jgi:hypothetical protein